MTRVSRKEINRRCQYEKTNGQILIKLYEQGDISSMYCCRKFDKNLSSNFHVKIKRIFEVRAISVERLCMHHYFLLD